MKHCDAKSCSSTIRWQTAICRCKCVRCVAANAQMRREIRNEARKSKRLTKPTTHRKD